MMDYVKGRKYILGGMMNFVIGSKKYFWGYDRLCHCQEKLFQGNNGF
jgi:hypothetical protein